MKYLLNTKEIGDEEREQQKRCQRNKKSKVADANPTLSMITLNVNGINIPIERHKLAE